MRKAWTAGVVVLWLALAGRAGAAEDAYFVAVFGAQRRFLNRPCFSHSFAAFAHLTPEGRLEAFTISWLPRTAKVRPLAMEPEEGSNFDLQNTLRLLEDNRAEVSCWGPYQTDPDLWRRALWQKGRLENGQVLYQAFDGGSPVGRVSNCLHAISIIARQPGGVGPRLVVAPANWGASGSYWLALALRPWYVDPCRTHDWLLPRLGVNPDGLTRRGLDRNPEHNPFARAVQAAFHADLLANRVGCDR